MTWQTVCLKDIVPKPWRNGGGTTRELVAWPDSAAWQWRVSVAEVAQSGPFSSFAGVQRWFAVLEGNGVCLTVDTHLHKLTSHDDPLMFDGAALTTCKLLDGATQDFNLMTQRGTTARMLRVKSEHSLLVNTPKIIATYAHKTGAMVQIGNEKHDMPPHSLGWMCVDANTNIRLQASDTLLMEINV